MGMYTDFVTCKVHLDPEMPPEIGGILTSHGKVVADHPLFSTTRMTTLMSNVWAYEKEDLGDRFSWTFIAEVNMKNYDSEIEQFVDWIAPYVDRAKHKEGDILGVYHYEDAAAMPPQVWVLGKGLVTLPIEARN